MKTKLIKTTFTIVCLIFIAGCTSPKSKQDKPTTPFYQKLHEELQSEHFSPVKLANPESLQVSSFSMKEDNGNVIISMENKKLQLMPDPIRLIHETGDHQHKQSMLVKLFLKDKKVHEINKLKSPRKSGNSIIFNTNLAGANIKVTPYNGFLALNVVPDFETEVDSVSLITTVDGPFFGGGERFMSTCLDGRTISNRPNDHSFIHNKLDELDLTTYEPTYLQIPFVMNPHGHGWYFDGAASMFLTFDSTGKSFRATARDHKMVLYIFQEEGPKAVLNSYTRLTGRQPGLPDWGYGVWINLLEGQDSVLAKATRLKQQEMPATAVWLFDMDDPNTSTGWPFWSNGIYRDYKSLTDSIHQLGFKALTYLRPFGFEDLLYYKFNNPFYELFDSLGVLLHAREELSGPRYSTFMKEGQYNFFNPIMGDLWKDMLSELLVKDQFDGWMEDFGDIAYSYDNEKNLWEAIDFGLDYGISDDEYANAYPLVYHQLTHKLSSEIKSDIVTFSRSGSAGSAPYTRLVWGGDQHANWDKKIGYPSAISAGISCGLSGYSDWAPDILCDSDSRELWKRWVQFGAFTPLMRDHLWSNKNTAIDIWTDSETFEYFKKYARIHMQLVPYIQKAALTYRETGTPIIRHMMLEFPEDPETYTCEYQYMFGDKYLVAPVVEEGATAKNIYFPNGKWKNFWNKTVIQSNGEWIEIDAPVDYIPVFEKI